MDSIPPLKRCSKCSTDFPALPEFFYRHRTTRDGLASWCKQCCRIYQQWYKGYAERKQVAQQEPRTDEQRFRAAAYAREYRKTHPERIREARNRYRSKPEVRALMRETEIYRRLGRKGRRPHRELVLNKIRAQHGKCYWCHKLLDKKYHIDHVIPVSRGGTNDPSNLVLTCPSCNWSKSDKLPHEWPEGGRLL